MSRPFFVITPDPVTEANLVSSNIPENDHPVWSSATAYMAGQRVIVTAGFHKIYESRTSNTNKFPPDNPVDWTEVGPTNRFAAFDAATGTIATFPEEIKFTVSGSNVQSVAVVEAQFTSIQLRVIVGGVEKFNSGFVKAGDKGSVLSWYDYFFNEIVLGGRRIFDELPVYPLAHYELTVRYTGGIVRLGNFIFGRRVAFGFTSYGASVGTIDSSRKEADEFGRVTLVERKARRRMSVRVIMPKHIVDSVEQKLTMLRAKPALYVGVRGSYEMLTVYGFPRDWNVEIETAVQSSASLEIESL